MFSKIHYFRTALNHRKTGRLLAYLATFAIATAAGSAPAFAHCERHVYNNSQNVWRMRIEHNPSNNIVDYVIQPGESRSYWLVTNAVEKNVWLEMQLGRGGEYVVYLGTQYNDCYIRHGMKESGAYNANLLSWNEPADGDITIH
jgi:hypothetical protein